MKSEIRFNADEKVIYTKSEGLATIDDLINGLDQLANNKNLPRSLRIIEDSRDVKTSISRKELEVAIPILNKLIDNFTCICHAVIHTDQKNTAISIILSDMIQNEKYKLEVFSSMDGAKKWIGV
jgi:hypothetical protein